MAWPYFYNRRGCPETIAAALAHPRYGMCLRAAATTFGRPAAEAPGSGAAAQAAARLGTERWVPSTPSTAHKPPERLHVPRTLSRVGAHDAKRAAANASEKP